MKVYNSVAHFIATAIKRLLAASPVIVADCTAVESTQTEVTAITALVPTYGPLAVTVENAGYALLGEIIAVLKASGAAAEAKLLDVGLDANVVATVKAVAADPTIQKVVKLI